ncbi:MAG: FAD-dependent oxidoreductase [Oxalobacter sp.]|nr:FAD-dependent oxidoreductase [Oxalobacter sp.]
MANEKEAPKPTCPVTDILEVLRVQLHPDDVLPAKVRPAVARVTRMITEITLGRSNIKALTELDKAAEELRGISPELGNALITSLQEKREEWEAHLAGSCTVGTCFKPRSAPCQVACPAHIDIPSMMAHIGHGNFSESLKVLSEDTPLPDSCGLVCPAPCEYDCVQNEVSGKPVFIRPMKHVAARCAEVRPDLKKAKPTGKKVAVVGCGPSGITAAYYLAQKGHTVEIFDEREHPGGVMRYGIPNYRLPDYKLYAEIDVVRDLGVEIHLGYHVGNAKEFQEKGYDATLLATGMQNSKRLGVPGDDQDFVIGGMDFLTAVRSGKNPRVGPHVIVIGGGNAAIDVAMTAFRQGAEKVQMWYRRNRKQMPANPHEVELALAEGVELVEFWAPTRVMEGGMIEFERSRYAPDAGKVAPVTVHADQIFAGIGQEADLSWLEGSKIETKWGAIVNDPETLMTAEEGIFASGDIAHGASTVVAAIGSGKRAALSIHEYLTGEKADYASLEPQRRDEVPFIKADPAQRMSADRAHIEEHDPNTRKYSHEFMQEDWDEKVAAVEAQRCLRCDTCIGCGLCELACIEVGAEALRMVETKGGRMVFQDLLRPADKCIGCGACASVCPTGAIKVEDRDGYRVTEITGSVVRKQPLEVCAVCGETFSASVVQVNQTSDILNGAAQQPKLCPACSRIQSAKAMKNMQWLAKVLR